MIKTFILVEDGSVDLDELKSIVGDDVLVISYRQGATPPAIQQPKEPVSQNSCMEQLKAENQMLWVAKMNSIVHSAEEIVMTELIYS